MSDLWHWAVTEAREMKRAPTACGVILAAGLFFGWEISNWYYRGQIDLLNLQVATYEKGVGVPTPSRQPAQWSSSNNAVWVLLAVVCAVAIGSAFSAVRNQRQVRQLDDEAQAQRTRVSEAEAGRRNLALMMLNAHAGGKFQTGNEPTVTIQFANYGPDYEMAKSIKKLFDEYIGWKKCDIVQVHNPAMRPADNLSKLVFMSAGSRTFARIFDAFNQGHLLGVPIVLSQPVHDDHERLIIQILPDSPVATVQRVNNAS